MSAIVSEQHLSATLKPDLDGFSHPLGDVDQHISCLGWTHRACGFPKQLQPSRKLVGLDGRMPNVRGHEVLGWVALSQPRNGEPEEIDAVQMCRPVVSKHCLLYTSDAADE